MGARPRGTQGLWRSTLLAVAVRRRVRRPSRAASGWGRQLALDHRAGARGRVVVAEAGRVSNRAVAGGEATKVQRVVRSARGASVSRGLDGAGREEGALGAEVDGGVVGRVRGQGRGQPRPRKRFLGKGMRHLLHATVGVSACKRGAFSMIKDNVLVSDTARRGWLLCGPPAFVQRAACRLFLTVPA